MERWLTLQETALELRISPADVLRLVRDNRVAYIVVGNSENAPNYRILDPSVSLREKLIEPAIERFPCISTSEVADIMGLDPASVRWHIMKGNLKGHKVGAGATCQVLHTPKDIRRFLARYEGRRGMAKHSYSKVIIRWMRSYFEEQFVPNAEVLQQLIDAAVILPEPERSSKISKLWKLFDEVNDLLKECKGIPAKEPPATQNAAMRSPRIPE